MDAQSLQHTLSAADVGIFKSINALHTPWADVAMYYISHKWFWLWAYALLLWWLVRHYGYKVVGVLLAIVLCITLADQISSAVFKPLFERLRPCHNPLIADSVHVVGGCGGMFGFVSSHAANAFGLVTLLWLLLRRRYPGIAYAFAWPLLLGYSRIYVGAHYPLDVLGGFIVGAFAAALSYQMYINLGRRVGLFKPEDIRPKAKGWV